MKKSWLFLVCVIIPVQLFGQSVTYEIPISTVKNLLDGMANGGALSVGVRYSPSKIDLIESGLFGTVLRQDGFSLGIRNCTSFELLNDSLFTMYLKDCDLWTDAVITQYGAVDIIRLNRHIKTNLTIQGKIKFINREDTLFLVLESYDTEFSNLEDLVDDNWLYKLIHIFKEIQFPSPNITDVFELPIGLFSLDSNIDPEKKIRGAVHQNNLKISVTYKYYPPVIEAVIQSESGYSGGKLLVKKRSAPTWSEPQQSGFAVFADWGLNDQYQVKSRDRLLSSGSQKEIFSKFQKSDGLNETNEILSGERQIDVTVQHKDEKHTAVYVGAKLLRLSGNFDDIPGVSGSFQVEGVNVGADFSDYYPKNATKAYQLKALPNTTSGLSWQFLHWNDWVTTADRTVLIDRDVSLTAYWKAMLTSRTSNWVQSQAQYSGNGKSAVIYKTEVNGKTDVWLHTEVNGQKREQEDFGTIDGVNVPLALAVTDYNHLRQYVAILHLDPSDHHLMAFEVINGISTNILDLNASNLELPSGLSQNAKLYISGYSAAVDYGGYPNGLLLVLVDGQTVYTAQSDYNGTNWGSVTTWSSFTVSGTPVFSTNGKNAFITWISNGNIVGKWYYHGLWKPTSTLFSNSGGNYTSFAASVNTNNDLVLLMIRNQKNSNNKQACYGKRYYSGGSSPVTVLESGLPYGNYKAWSVAVEGSKVLASIGKAPDGETWNYYLWKNDGSSWTKETSPFSATPARLLHNEVDEYPVEATIQPDGVTNLYALKTNLVSWPSGGPGLEKDGEETDGFSIVASRLSDTTETWITVDPASIDSIVIDTLKVWNIAMKQTGTREYLMNRLNTVGSAVYVDSSATIRFVPSEARYSFYVVDPSGNKFRIRKSAIGGEQQDDPVLSANVSVFPNPFNPVTVLSVTMPEAGTARLTVYNILGQQVASLVNGHLNAGVHDLQFNASNLSSGTYLYRFEAGETVKTGKLQLMK